MNLKELQEKRNGLVGEIQTLRDAFNANGEKWENNEQREKWSTVNADLDSVSAEIDAAKEAAEVFARADSVAEMQERSAYENRQRPGFDLGAGEAPQEQPERQEPTAEQRNLSLQAWMRHGEGRPLSDRQREACEATGVNPAARSFDFRFVSNPRSRPGWESRAGLDTITSGAGQETIPQGFMASLERTLLEYGGPRKVARILRTNSGNDIPWPTVNDTSNTGELLSEATSIGASVDPTFSSVTLNAYKYHSKPILLSSEILEDSAFNLSSEVGALLGERIGRITATHFTTGDNSSKPQGLVTGASAGVTATSATAIDADEIFDLVHSLDPAYRKSLSCGFMMHDNVLLYLRKLKDGNGVYMWQAGMSASEPDRLAGYPVTINQDMASSVASSNVTVLFGAYEKYIIRDIANVKAWRLDERYRDTDQTGFVTFTRHDGRYINTSAVKKLTQAA